MLFARELECLGKCRRFSQISRGIGLVLVSTHLDNSKLMIWESKKKDKIILSLIFVFDTSISLYLSKFQSGIIDIFEIPTNKGF